MALGYANLEKRHVRTMPSRKCHCRMQTITRILPLAYYIIPWNSWEAMDTLKISNSLFLANNICLTCYLIV